LVNRPIILIFWQIPTNFAVWYLSLVVFIYNFDKLKPFSVSEIQTPNLSLVGIYIWFWQTQTVFAVWNSDTQFISSCKIIWFWQTRTVFGVWNSDTQFFSSCKIIYDFDKLEPFSVSEIQTPNFSLAVKLYMILTNSNRFRCQKFRHLIYLCLVFIYHFDKLRPFSVSEIQTPNFSLVVKLYMILTNSNRFRCLKFRHPNYLEL
jgi:hypothetical protein